VRFVRILQNQADIIIKCGMEEQVNGYDIVVIIRVKAYNKANIK
jgi:hypothetical protein